MFEEPRTCIYPSVFTDVVVVFFLFTVCNFVVHDRCLKTVVSACSSIATNLIKVKYRPYPSLQVGLEYAVVLSQDNL